MKNHVYGNNKYSFKYLCLWVFFNDDRGVKLNLVVSTRNYFLCYTSPISDMLKNHLLVAATNFNFKALCHGFAKDFNVIFQFLEIVACINKTQFFILIKANIEAY